MDWEVMGVKGMGEERKRIERIATEGKIRTRKDNEGEAMKREMVRTED